MSARQPALAARVLTAVLAILAAALGSRSPRAGSDPGAEPPLRIGFSARTLGSMNRADARAALMAWTRTILNRHGIIADPEPRIFEDPGAIFESLRDGTVDGVTMQTHEFFRGTLEREPDTVYVVEKAGSVFSRYVVLVQRDRGFRDLADLRGRDIVFFDNQKMGLAMPWIETSLDDAGLPLPEVFFSKITRSESASKTILQVFFRQADACVVEKAAFETAGELNPQVGQRLLALATSPELIPALFFTRPGISESMRSKIDDAITELQGTPTGHQLLNVFQADRMVRRPFSCLEGTRRLLQERDRIASKAAPSGERIAARAAAR